MLKNANKKDKTHIFLLYEKKYIKGTDGVKTDTCEGNSGQHFFFLYMACKVIVLMNHLILSNSLSFTIKLVIVI